MTTTTATATRVRTVTPADRADRSAVSTALSGAFYDDPVFRWVYPDDDRRRTVLPAAFNVFTDAIARHRVSQVAGDGVGAALWVPPGEQVVDDDQAEAFGQALVALSGEDAERLEVCMGVLGASHPHERCWYLNLLGVVPERQGEGIGSALLRAALARGDESGEPAYLEATSHGNRRMYERHGFRVVDELHLPDGPSLWPMWRDPQGS